MQQSFPLRQIRGGIEWDHYWRSACRAEFLSVLREQEVVLILSVLMTPIDPDIAGA
jgi:hypothetical protein